MVEKTEKEKRRNGWYYQENRAYAGVTTILKIIDKSDALIPWASKIVAIASKDHPDWSVEKLVAEPYAKRDSAGEKGTTIHSLAEAMGRGNIPDISKLPESVRGYAQAVVDFHKFCVKKVLYSEFTVFNDTHRYAGTGDEIFIGYDDKTYIGDFKTGKYIYKPTGLQLSAYKHGEYMLDNVSKKKIALPKIDELICILFQETGKYSTEVFVDGFEHFLAAKKLYEWNNVDTVKRVKNIEKELFDATNHD